MILLKKTDKILKTLARKAIENEQSALIRQITSDENDYFYHLGRAAAYARNFDDIICEASTPVAKELIEERKQMLIKCEPKFTGTPRLRGSKALKVQRAGKRG